MFCNVSTYFICMIVNIFRRMVLRELTSMKKILIIGKGKKAAKFFSIFTNQRFLCLQANTELEAFTYFEKESIDLFLIVDSFTDINGRHIYEKIRKRSTLPIIIIFNDEEISDVVRALRGGADVCLIEPIDKDELLARTEAVLRRSRII